MESQGPRCFFRVFVAPFRYKRASDLPQEGAAMQDAFAEMTGARTVPRVTWLTWLVEVMLALENSNNPYRPGEFDINGNIIARCLCVFSYVFVCFFFSLNEKVSSPTSCKSQLSHGTYPLFSTFWWDLCAWGMRGWLRWPTSTSARWIFAAGRETQKWEHHELIWSSHGH